MIKCIYLIMIMVISIFSLPSPVLAQDSEDPQDKEKYTFELLYKNQNSILLFNQKEYELHQTEGGWLLPSKEFLNEIPTIVKVDIQIIHKLYITPETEDIGKIIYGLARQFDQQISLSHIIRHCGDVAFSQKKTGFLKHLIRYSSTQEQKGWIYFYLAQLEKNWLKKLEYARTALFYSPTKTYRLWGQDFSISVAQAVLNTYKEELLKAGILRKLDMENAKPTRLSSLKEALINTTFAAKLTLTDYGEKLQKSWENQIVQIDHLRSLFSQLQKLIRQEEKDLRELTDNALTLTSEEKNIFTHLKQTLFFSNIIQYGIYYDFDIDGKMIPYPSIKNLGINIDIDFVDYTFKTLGVGQINLLNYWMFFRFPKQIKWFGKTRAGKWTVETLRLQSLVSRVGKCPRWLQPIVMCLIVETADGCVIRYIYTIATGYSKLTQKQELEIEKQIQKQFL